jgi:hypothetical protein
MALLRATNSTRKTSSHSRPAVMQLATARYLRTHFFCSYVIFLIYASCLVAPISIPDKQLHPHPQRTTLRMQFITRF